MVRITDTIAKRMIVALRAYIALHGVTAACW